MKKILALIVILAGIAAAQFTGNDPRLPNIPRDANGIRGSVLLRYNPYTGLYYPVDTLGVKIMETTTDFVHSFFKTDTLVMSSTGADTTCTGSAGDTVYHYFQGKFLYGFVCIDDSQKAASGALTDSIFVDRYDTSTATWRAYMVGCKNLYDNSVYGNPLIPGNNLQKMYLINEPYPMSYRVRYAAYWGNAQALVRKTVIRWEWKAM
jgi:hypothetical protein